MLRNDVTRTRKKMYQIHQGNHCNAKNIYIHTKMYV